MIHDLPVIPYGGINMYSVCGFEVASPKYSFNVPLWKSLTKSPLILEYL
jgi:hypothetical protein